MNSITKLISADGSLVNIFVKDHIIQTHLKLTALEIKDGCELTEETEDYFEKFKVTNNSLYTVYKHEINKVFTYF